MTLDRSLQRDIVIGGIVLLCLVGLGAFRAARQPATATEGQTTAQVSTDLDGRSHQLLDAANRPIRKSTRQAVLEQIDKHKDKIALDPADEEVPAYQVAIANLYITKLADFESASVQLEEMISEFPDSNLVPQAYVKLAKCYDYMGLPSMADATYAKMMRHFPEGSTNWEYARAKRRGDANIY
jgi:TolA-binding protein